MLSVSTLRSNAYQFKDSTAAFDLQDFVQSLQSIQENLELGPSSADINTASVSTHISDLSTMKTYFKEMQKTIKNSGVRPGGEMSLQWISETRTHLYTTIIELLGAQHNCRRIEDLKEKHGKEVSDERNAEYQNLYAHLKACEEPLGQAEENIQKLKELYPETG